MYICAHCNSSHTAHTKKHKHAAKSSHILKKTTRRRIHINRIYIYSIPTLQIHIHVVML